MVRPAIINVAREKARANGEKYYTLETPCSNGHSGPLSVATGKCIQCTKEWTAKWRSTPENVEKANTTRREHRRTQVREKRLVEGPRKPYAKNREKIISVVVDGQSMTVAEACVYLQIGANSIYNKTYSSKKSCQEVVDYYVLKRDNPHVTFVKTKAKRVPGAPRPRVHYLENSDILVEIAKSKEKDKITDKLASMIMLMTTRFFARRNYYKYSYVDEMKDESLLQVLAAVMKFNPEKSLNPFSYFTQVMKNAANRILNREKKLRETNAEQRIILRDLLEEEAPGSQSRNPQS